MLGGCARFVLCITVGRAYSEKRMSSNVNVER